MCRLTVQLLTVKLLHSTTPTAIAASETVAIPAPARSPFKQTWSPNSSSLAIIEMTIIQADWKDTPPAVAASQWQKAEGAIVHPDP